MRAAMWRLVSRMHTGWPSYAAEPLRATQQASISPRPLALGGPSALQACQRAHVSATRHLWFMYEALSVFK